METFGSLLRFIAPIVVASLLAGLLSRYLRRPVPDGPEDEAYKVFTREFDLALPAGEVLARLATASPDGSKGWLSSGGAEPALDVVSLLAAQRIATAGEREDVMARLQTAVASAQKPEVVVTVLVDQSGSMRGPRIAFSAVTAALIAELADALGARSEVLGFSTAGWCGGHARAKWLKEGRPKRPGRLAALMHVIYKSAEDAKLGEDAMRAMVHPDLLRENIDGEAILWAHERLAARHERRKILIVVSDGAPVDDSTLMQNGPSYLYRHILTVLRQMENEADLVLGGIGVEHRVESFYPLSETAESPEDLPRLGIRLLERLLAEPGAKGSRRTPS